MKSIGRVSIVPKGYYKNGRSYKRLDFIKYGGSAYVCKQDCTNVYPTNTTYWMETMSISDMDDIAETTITEMLNNLVTNHSVYQVIEDTLTVDADSNNYILDSNGDEIISTTVFSTRQEINDINNNTTVRMDIIENVANRADALSKNLDIELQNTNTHLYDVDTIANSALELGNTLKQDLNTTNSILNETISELQSKMLLDDILDSSNKNITDSYGDEIKSAILFVDYSAFIAYQQYITSIINVMLNDINRLKTHALLDNNY
jgi:hypothetical protein